MSSKAYDKADIRIGEVTWSKTTPHAQAASLQKHLLQLAELAGDGLVLDCAFVEVANSELLNLLVRVRTAAKKQNKGFALFDVPDSLANTIKVCNLGSVLPIAAKMEEAKKIAYDLSGEGSQLARTFKRFLKM
jgi:anti-anti-sigma factor